MHEEGFHIDELPELNKPLLIAGFAGWGNALDISKGMVTYLIRKLKARRFARINPDVFYRYDESRPLVAIEEGVLEDLSPPGGSFYAVKIDSGGNDLVILKANEPSLRWFHFVDELFYLCRTLAVETIITIGSMYDNVLHTDRIISGIASDDELFSRLREKNVIPINYQGPSAIHSIIHSEGQRKGFRCISLWGHCPYYIQGTTHYGLLSTLGALLSSFGEFELDLTELDRSWGNLNQQILELIQNNPELQAMISELRKAKVRGSWESMKGSIKKDDKVINLRDFLVPR